MREEGGREDHPGILKRAILLYRSVTCVPVLLVSREAEPRPGSEESDDSSFDDDNMSLKSRRGSEEDAKEGRCRLRPSFVATHLLPTLATVNRAVLERLCTY